LKKRAHDVKPGDAVTIELGAHGDERAITIAAIPVRRGPASEAATCYAESAESVERRRAAAEARALAPPPPTPGRPDKRTRRLLLRARDRR
jgi:ribosome-associated heat shock protein Hsp15